MKIESFSISNKNTPNEDRLKLVQLGESWVAAILADGMGGLCLGDIAAEIAVNSIAERLPTDAHANIEQKNILKALDYADEMIQQARLKNRSKMGAAVAVAVIKDNILYCTWQGNVRIYVQHKQEIKLLTNDHIANLGYGRTALTRCIKGDGLRDDVPFITYELSNIDSVILCTDGLYNIAEKHLPNTPVNELRANLHFLKDDASLIKISLKS